jgi:hypothetical protein
MTTLHERAAPQRQGTAGRPTSSGRSVAVILLVDLVAPDRHLLRAAVGRRRDLLALLAGAVLPGLTTLAKLLRDRRLDRLGVFVITMPLLSAGAALIAGSPRFLLAKEGWITAVVGIWFLASLRGRRPLTFLFSRPLLEGRRLFGSPAGASWAALWRQAPRFRRIWSVATII